MKRTKIILALILSVVMLLSVTVVLAACSEEKSNPSTTIYFYTSQGQALQEKTQVAIQNFEAKYPGWKVQHTAAGSYDDVKSKVLQDLQARQQPDLAYCYPDHVAEYLATGAVVNINDLINSTETVKDANGNDVTVGYTAAEQADFVSGYWNEGYASNYADYEQWGLDADAMLTLPFSKSTELLYTNTSALIYAKEHAGSADKRALFAPTEEDTEAGRTFHVAQTWDELWAQCKVLKELFPNCTPLGYDSEANWFITMCEQNGWGFTAANGNHYLFDNENTKAWLTELKGYYDQKLFTTEEIYGQYTSNLFKLGVGKLQESKSSLGVVNQNNSLEKDDGGCVYCIGSSGGASYQKSDTGNFQMGIYPLPGSKKSDGTITYRQISQGPSLVMLKGGYRLDAEQQALKLKMTFLFVKELMEPTFQASFSIASGYNPVRESVFDIEAYSDFISGTDSTAMAAATAKLLSDRFFISPAFDGSSIARSQVGNALVYAVKNEKPVDKALSDAVANCPVDL